MGFETVSLTDVGRHRDHNEDSVYSKTSGTAAVVAVADGMGGHRAGDVASEAALDAFVAFLDEHDWADTETARRDLLATAADAANSHLQEMVTDSPELDGMGTTLVAALLQDGEATVVNVGDSRCYHLSDEGIEQVTTDQSLVQQLVEQGSIEPEEADDHPQKHVLTQALGTEERIDPDTYHLSVTDVLLLCSDGLSDEVPDAKLYEAVSGAGSLSAAAETLVELANDHDGSDNVSVALARRV
jgi:serine/threonine protein phosphatase PrpC